MRVIVSNWRKDLGGKVIDRQSLTVTRLMDAGDG